MLNRQDRPVTVEQPTNPKATKVSENKASPKITRAIRVDKPPPNVPHKPSIENTTPVKSKKQSQEVSEQSPKFSRRTRRILIDDESKKEATDTKPSKVATQTEAINAKKNTPLKKTKPVPKPIKVSCKHMILDSNFDPFTFLQNLPKSSETELKTPESRASKKKPEEKQPKGKKQF